MTRTDRKIIFTALAFFAIAAKSKRAATTEEEEEVRKLASLAEGFCARNVGDMLATIGTEADAVSVDGMIERHISELRDEEETRLPKDMAVLINVHDRLLQRKARRAQREFYAFANWKQIQDEVLKLLDEEIEDVSSAKLA